MKKLISVFAVVFFIFNFVNAQDNKYIPEPNQQTVAGQGKGFQNGINVNSSPEDPIYVKIVDANGNKNAGSTTKWRTKTVHDRDTTIINLNLVNTITIPESQQQPGYSLGTQERFQDNYFVERKSSADWMPIVFLALIGIGALIWALIHFARQSKVAPDVTMVTNNCGETELSGPVKLQNWVVPGSGRGSNSRSCQGSAPSSPVNVNVYTGNGAVQTVPSTPEKSSFLTPDQNYKLEGEITPIKNKEEK